jgi:hypothetical protein
MVNTDRESGRSLRRREAISDPRESPRLRLAVSPSEGRLREVLGALDWELVDLERSSVERVRLILSEILVRSTGRADEQVRIDVFVLSETIRIELSGPTVALPQDVAAMPETAPTFPSWLLTHLVDRWGINQRNPERGLWLLIEREY